ncbi:MAG: DUF1924 domain-containing protein, partial [Gammaproteobacteria bacterium]|nr:DUF1924 domain-containing protein [Gammaproteobacteria bacterium]
MKINRRGKMMNMKPVMLLSSLVLSLLLAPSLQAAGSDAAFETYRSAGAGNFSAAAGEKLWKRDVLSAKDNKMHNCGSCHTNNLKQVGKHHRTKK